MAAVATATATTTASTARLCAIEFVEVYPKLFENHSIPKSLSSASVYTEISISRAHGSNRSPKISPGDGLGAEF